MPLTAAVLSEDLIRAAAASAPITASSRTDDIPASWDERAVLTTMLDYARDTVHVKCAGLSDEQARWAPLPGSPLTTISSLVSHLRWVEYYWIRVVLLGEQDRAPVTEDDPDAEMRLGLHVPSPGCWPSTGPAAASSASWSRRLTLMRSPGARRPGATSRSRCDGCSCT